MTISGYLYLIRNTLTNHYKIGVARDVQSRLQHLQTANSAKLDLIISVKVYHPYDKEKEIHDIFAVKRLEGEWFKLTNDDVQKIMNMFLEYEAKDWEFTEQESWFDSELYKIQKARGKRKKFDWFL